MCEPGRVQEKHDHKGQIMTPAKFKMAKDIARKQTWPWKGRSEDVGNVQARVQDFGQGAPSGVLTLGGP